MSAIIDATIRFTTWICRGGRRTGGYERPLPIMFSRGSPSQIRGAASESLRDNSWRERAFVEDRYRERAPQFFCNARFLENSDGSAVRVPSFGGLRTDWRSFARGRIRRVARSVARFLGAHQRVFCPLSHAVHVVVDGRRVMSARGSFPPRRWPARDFLMELGAVRLIRRRRSTSSNVHLVGPTFGRWRRRSPRAGRGTKSPGLKMAAPRLDAESRLSHLSANGWARRWANQVRHVAGERPSLLRYQEHHGYRQPRSAEEYRSQGSLPVDYDSTGRQLK